MNNSTQSNKDLTLNKAVNNLVTTIFQEKHGSSNFILKYLRSNLSNPDIHSYIPQLCFLFFVKDYDELRLFLNEYAYENVSNYFLLNMIWKAYNENPPGVSIHENFLRLHSKLAQVFVNNGLKASQNIPCKVDDLDQDFYLKDARATYLERQDQLVFNLIEQSLTLKKIDIQMRKQHMTAFLQKINQNIEYLQKYILPQFGGITLPFNHGTRESCLIVNILDDEFICFNTAKRVPYKIIIETVDPCEVYLIDRTVQLIENKAPELNAAYDIESEMKAISQLKIFHSYNIDELKELAHAKIEELTNPNKKRKQTIVDKDIYQSRSDSRSPWGDDWKVASAKIKSQSKYGKLKSYLLRQIIVKGGDDLRSELLVMQMMRKVNSIFQLWGVKLYLRPYDIILTSPNSGILEFIPNTLSVDKIKKDYPDYSLKQFYFLFFDDFEEAKKSFAQSLAGYSLVCYLFQLKDRHNGNILIDNLGHIIHIDFGFVLTLTPGNLNFESAPFKLTAEYEELLEGKDSDLFMYYKSLIVQGFISWQQHVEEIMAFMKAMLCSPKHNMLQCLQKFNLQQFRDRFHETKDFQQLTKLVENLVDDASGAISTKIYDYFQFKSNTIYY